MHTSLLQQFPRIAARGKEEGRQILEKLACSRYRMLRSSEWAVPVTGTEPSSVASVREGAPNRLVHGADLLAMALLLDGAAGAPSMRGQVDLISADLASDPRFIRLRESPEMLAAYLAILAPRLVVLGALIKDRGTIVLSLGSSAGTYVQILADDILDRRQVQVHPGGAASGGFDLEAAILKYTTPGALVADFFGGAGSTAAIAERLGRRWAVSEPGRERCLQIRKRLVEQCATPFLYEEVGGCRIAG